MRRPLGGLPDEKRLEAQEHSASRDMASQPAHNPHTKGHRMTNDYQELTVGEFAELHKDKTVGELTAYEMEDH